MSLKDKKYKRIYRTSTFIFLLGIIGSLYYIHKLDLKLKEFQQQNVVPLSQFEALEKENANFEQLLEIDVFWLKNKDAKATLKKFKEVDVSKTGFKKDWVNNRIERLEDIIASSKDDELTKINLRSELRAKSKEIDSIYKVMDSISFDFSKNKSIATKKIDSLSKVIQEKSLQINRNETVKLISFRNENKHLIHYIGEIENEMANGNGIGIWNTGSIYRGNWTENKRHGEGEFVWDDGAKYEGDFVMGERTGNGTFYYSSGEKYQGEFKKGLRHGKGILYDRDGNVSYEGNWKNDKPNQ